MTRARVHRRQRPARPGGRRGARGAAGDRRARARRPRHPASPWSGTGPRCWARPSWATGCCSTRSPAIPRFVPVGVLSVDRAEVVDTAAPLAGRVAAFWLEGKAAPGAGLSAEPDRPGRGADGTAPDRADHGLGVGGGDRRGHRGPRRAGRPDRQPLHDFRRRRWPPAGATSTSTSTRARWPTSGRSRRSSRPLGAERVLFGYGLAAPRDPVVDQRDPRRAHPRRRQARDPGRQRGPHLRPARRDVSAARGRRGRPATSTSTRTRGPLPWDIP